ncbi:hypothetical protein COCSADRAFT_226139 [Bipolaris sorokiniana ND90Pr]|uniref:Uncharacterized protein n=1 Tax=Cochliobolus sativus (strain ND90Pr / ATCC 201652) TaxID=665912 RepID=M2SHR7_COCSN|nr:uncharacterized protein COCSADRAFT_226139 [Bipolaris sorokiniana ND90Pr]EMD61950.1 hypothetical protein COCSADRAFT_226139 [Bipolaris sorokiniana ND90Pr]
MLFVEPGLVRVKTTPFRLLLSPIALHRVPNKDIIAPCYPSVTPECPAAKPRALLSRLHAAANYGVAWPPRYRSLACFFLSSPSHQGPPNTQVPLLSTAVVVLFCFREFYSSSPLLGYMCSIFCVRSIHSHNTACVLVEQRLCLGVKLQRPATASNMRRSISLEMHTADNETLSQPNKARCRVCFP